MRFYEATTEKSYGIVIVCAESVTAALDIAKAQYAVIEDHSPVTVKLLPETAGVVAYYFE